MEQAFQFSVKLIKIGAKGGDLADLGHGRWRILPQNGFQQLVQMTVIERAQHRQHAVEADAAVAVSQRLISQAQSIAHTAVSRFGQGQQGARFEGLPLLIQHPFELLGDLGLIQTLQMKLQAARENGDR